MTFTTLHMFGYDHLTACGMMAECRLCKITTDAKRTIHLFTLENRWAFRISSLLKVAVFQDEKISPHVCTMCTRRLESLEKANADLQAFQELAQRLLEAQTNTLKRTRVTSGEVGVSLDTARARPSSKLSRKKLTYECKYITSHSRK